MTDQGCTVSFDGDHGGEYYVPCDQVKYLSKDNLTNSGSSRIILRSRRGGGDVGVITIDSLNYPSYSDNYHYVYLTGVSNIKFNWKSQFYYYHDYLVLFYIFIVCVFALRKVVSRV